MALEALTEMPAQLAAGATWKVQRAFSDYPASESWVVTYYFVNQSAAPQDFECTAVGDEHLLTVPASSSANFAAGVWFYEARAAKAGEVAIVASGRVQVTADLSTVAAASDQRSHARKTLDAIEAAIEGRATAALLETEINTGATTRRLKYMSLDELIKAQSRYKYLVAQEERKERGRSSLIYGRFTV